MAENSNSKKYILLIIGVLLLVFLVYYCSRPKALPNPPEPNPILDSTTKNISYFAIDLPLIAQKGDKACWAATLQMMFPSDSNSYPNTSKTSPIRLDSLKKYLSTYKSDKYAKTSDPSWMKIKQELSAKNGLVTYKYFNNLSAHVFLVRGFQESQKSKWLIVNDPWPVGKAKITALAFNQFLRPLDGKQNYDLVEYSPSSASTQILSEPTFNIISANSLKGEYNEIYQPPYKIEIASIKNSKISSKNAQKLLNDLKKSFKNFDPLFFVQTKIDFLQNKDILNEDLKSLVYINLFSNTNSFTEYDKYTELNSDYIFDGKRLAFVNLLKNEKPIVTSTIELEDKASKPYFYVSRFENYWNSEKADWDRIKEDFEKILKKPSILALLTGNRSARLIGAKAPQKVEPQIEDISMLPLQGGMAFSFTYPPFEEKIAADPYRQLKIKPGHKALFISESGIPFFRLSSISIPGREEDVPKNIVFAEEWNTPVESFNISTGINADQSNAIPLAAQDPNWRIVSNGNPAFAVAPYGAFWQPAPINGTKAQWISSSNTNSTQIPGFYTFERSINITKDCSKLIYDFKMAIDDDLASLELVAPDGAVTDLTPKFSRSASPTIYFLSPTIKGEILSPKKGIWKIRAKANFIDAVAAFILSGNVTTKW